MFSKLLLMAWPNITLSVRSEGEAGAAHGWQQLWAASALSCATGLASLCYSSSPSGTGEAGLGGGGWWDTLLAREGTAWAVWGRAAAWAPSSDWLPMPLLHLASWSCSPSLTQLPSRCCLS